MPRLLPERFRPDTINEFLAAASSRSKEAWAMLECGHRTAAIYLWGYVGEVILKAAWFRLIGYAVDQRIGMSDLHQAQAQGKVLGMSWKGNLHNLQAWAELIVEQRKSVGPAYYAAHTSGAVLQQASTIQARWREVIRYKANTAYLHEARSVAESVLWLLIHADQI